MIIGPEDDPWGILGTHDTDRRTFDDHEVNFVRSVANVLATAIGRHGYEEELLRQRAQLEAMNTVNEVVREVTEAVTEQSTREQIEVAVCDRLAAQDGYEFAWIGEVDVHSQTVELRTESGVEGYLDDVTISVDPDDERSQGPTGRALRTGEIQTTADVHADDRYEPWLGHVEEYGFRSTAAIPIVHDDSVYGVMSVYAEEPHAFEGRERDVVAQLGEVVGHAIAATERKRALMSDEVVELEFHIQDVVHALGIGDESAGTIRLDHTIPLADDDYLVYGTTTADGVATVEALTDALPHWSDVSFRDAEGDTAFELRLSEPPVLSALASLGGSVEEAVMEDGDYVMTLHTSPGGDVRRIIEAVQDAYPQAELQKRRQFTREETVSPTSTQGVLGDLTDRQRAAVEAAHHAGFFQWPRESSGEEVAAALDVSSPTFHQHLRKAEKKVFDALLAPAAGSA